MEFFDTHAHYDDSRFDEDRDLLLRQLHQEGVSLILNPATDLSSSQTICALAERHSFLYAGIGFYPHDTGKMTTDDLDALERMAKEHPKVKAIGEIGLDYYYDDTPREVQRKWLRAQMELARALDLPVSFHDREAHEDSLNIVKEFPGVRGVFHCFSGSVELARELWKRGWSTSFTGSITFKNAKKLPEVVAACPPDRIMLETDAPYLAPVPHRGKRNHSGYLPWICQAAAAFRNCDPEALAALTLENGRRFFRLEGKEVEG